MLFFPVTPVMFAPWIKLVVAFRTKIFTEGINPGNGLLRGVKPVGTALNKPPTPSAKLRLSSHNPGIPQARTIGTDQNLGNGSTGTP